MKVAIVTVTYNSVEVLDEYAQHLAELDVADVVIVDNASSDGSADAARPVAGRLLELDANVGFGRACNLGASTVSDVDAFLFLNPDCYVTGETLDALTEVLESTPNVGAVAPAMVYPSGGVGISAGQRVSLVKEWLAFLRVDERMPALVKRAARATHRRLGWPSFAEYAHPSRATHGPPQDQGWLSGFCLLVRGSAFAAVGGFDERFFLYFEDVDLCVRLRRKGWKLLSIQGVAATHLESTSTEKAGKSRHYYRGLCTYYEIHGSPGQRCSARLLMRIAGG